MFSLIAKTKNTNLMPHEDKRIYCVCCARILNDKYLVSSTEICFQLGKKFVLFVQI